MQRYDIYPYPQTFFPLFLSVARQNAVFYAAMHTCCSPTDRRRSLLKVQHNVFRTGTDAKLTAPDTDAR